MGSGQSQRALTNYCDVTANKIVCGYIYHYLLKVTEM